MDTPGFTWVSPIFCVEHVPRSLEHYRDVLGFEIAWSWSAEEAFEGPPHPTFACVTRGDMSLFLCEQGQGHPGAWVMFNVSSRDDLEAVHREYTASGANVLEPPVDCSWGMREMLVADPDGNTLRIGCAIDD